MSHSSGPSSANQRRQYFVDPAVQGALLRQALWYWFCASATFAFIIFIYRVVPPWLTGKPDATGHIWYHLAPYLLASAVLFPIVVLRAIRFSHRFCGPMVPIRRALKQLAHGEETPPTLKLRRTDYWKDIADEINAISERLEKATLQSDPPPSDTSLHLQTVDVTRCVEEAELAQYCETSSVS